MIEFNSFTYQNISQLIPLSKSTDLFLEYMFCFALGLFVGVFIMCLLQINRGDDDRY